ncbi:hypothetical protein BDV39DRAFT_167673 [Aspergillus sergii]|uniref:Uncharacterized protein n=1 Tax=Aspergillus sergii TaxID=1034303 RepID=A0A5N6XJZ0_9EURO|nr:hypothetical protein BDV39DRAFT_167673 [Aspergillus sergii]
MRGPARSFPFLLLSSSRSSDRYTRGSTTALPAQRVSLRMALRSRLRSSQPCLYMPPFSFSVLSRPIFTYETAGEALYHLTNSPLLLYPSFR